MKKTSSVQSLMRFFRKNHKGKIRNTPTITEAVEIPQTTKMSIKRNVQKQLASDQRKKFTKPSLIRGLFRVVISMGKFKNQRKKYARQAKPACMFEIMATRA